MSFATPKTLRGGLARYLRSPSYYNPRVRSYSKALKISEEVRQAVHEGRPVVALESALYTHGYPYPSNVALSSLLESVVRTNGGVPATIGVLDGVARVGMDADDLIKLASSAGQPGTRKVSRRDLSYLCGLGSLGQKMNGGTTISGTMVLCQLAGIKIFATGGLGGVHRGAQTSMDVSADLTELGRTAVAVISSGCKAFLDIPKTLEYLETEGVPVATFADGRSGQVDFPGFWSRDSGSVSPMTIQSEVEAAAMIHAQHELGLSTGLLLANPIPADLSFPKAEIDRAIEQAVLEAEQAGATGNKNTPYILDKIKDLTGSRSVEVNKGLLTANAKRGTLVAVELARLQGNDSTHSHHPVMIGPGAENYSIQGLSKGLTPPSLTRAAGNAIAGSADRSDAASFTEPARDVQDLRSTGSAPHPSVLVAGSIAMDLSCDQMSTSGIDTPKLHTSNPALITQSIGGVGHNVARAIHTLGTSVGLCSVVGDDLAGKTLANSLSQDGLRVDGIHTLPDHRTSQYVALNASDKSLFTAMADMSIIEHAEPLFESTWAKQLAEAAPRIVVTDGNWVPPLLRRWLQAAKDVSAMTIFEPVSMAKCTRLLDDGHGIATYPTSLIDIASPNSFELTAMHSAARQAGLFDREDWWRVIDAFGISSSGARVQLALGTTPDLVDQGIPQQSIQLLPFIPKILTKLGSQGVLLTQILPARDPRLSDGRYAPYILSRCCNGSEEDVEVGGIYLRLFPPAEEVPQQDIVSVNGVGDTFLGAVVVGLAADEGRHLEDLVPLAQRAAVMTLKSAESVSPGLVNLRLAGL